MAVSAAILGAATRPTISRDSRKPAIVSSGGASSILRACALAKASVEPSPRLIAGRSTSLIR
jgi:hypothetical protein